MNKIIDRTFIIEWGLPKKYIGDIQDYFGVDESENICSIKIQLLHNVGSKVLKKEPQILAAIPKGIQPFVIKESLFNTNKILNNHCQFLYKDDIIFSYTNSTLDNLINSSLIYKMFSKNVFALFDDKMQLHYIILKDVSKFNFNKIKSSFNNEKVIPL
ncbi:hypothetical protein, partial [Tenacibaculum maritimum]